MSETAPNTSPIVRRQPGQMTFPEAIQEVIDGQQITRVEWNDPEIYVCLRFGKLLITSMKEGQKDPSAPPAPLIMTEGDLLATDWIVVRDQ